jgi:hypothetical protein
MDFLRIVAESAAATKGRQNNQTHNQRMYMKKTTAGNRLLIAHEGSKFEHSTAGLLRRIPVLLGAAAAGLLLTAPVLQADGGWDGHGWQFGDRDDHRVGAIFVIAMENHNLVQPVPTNSPEQIFGNPAAPYLNSLMTPGNSNSVHASFSTAYYNSGVGVHPSEPNYVWAEAGTDFGVHTDADPRAANGNTFYDQAVHFTAQLDAVGISWKNYQEDVQLSVSPTNSASGTNAPVNAYNGSTQYNYAVKHNPMAFFTDSAVSNVYPLSQLSTDLGSDAVGRFNWITPDQYNDAHSSLNGGFTYQGVHYTGDQSSIATGDNFLSQIVPQIMASEAYKHNGTIIIWWDETENGDDTNHSIPEIVISSLSKGNAYASTVPVNHSSDIKTFEEIFHLPALNNPIPTNETDVFGTGFNNVATVNDLSDLFAPETIPAVQNVFVHRGRFVLNHRNGHVLQEVAVSNEGETPAAYPLWLVLDNLSANATLLNSNGTSSVLAPLGSPYVNIANGDGDSDFGDYLLPHESRIVTLEFMDPTAQNIRYDTRVLSVVPAP